MSLRSTDIRILTEDELINKIGHDLENELNHLRKATPSAESAGLASGNTHDSLSVRLYGEDAAEVDRTILGVFALRWILNGDYRSFTES